MNEMNLTELGIKDLRELLNKKEVSATELTNAFIQNIEESSKLNAFIEKTFDLASQRYIFSYNPKDRPTKKFSYFFTIELKNGSVYATPIDNSGMVVPYIFEVEDPLEYYKKRSMKRD